MGKGMGCPHRLQRPRPFDKIAAGNPEAEPGIVARQLRAFHLLHADTGFAVPLHNGTGFLEAGIVFRDQQMPDPTKLERNRTVGQLGVYLDTLVEHLDHGALRS